jgi:hypothetical protein
MQARDGPEITPPVVIETAPADTPRVTRNDKPVKAEKGRSQATSKKPRLPGGSRSAKPPGAAGYHRRKNGAGWELRKGVYVTRNDGSRQRKQPFVAHLSREAFGEMKRKHRGASLEKAIAQWIEDHDR